MVDLNDSRSIKMPLVLTPVVEADLPEITKIERAAFASLPIDLLIRPNGHTTAILESALKNHQKRFSLPDYTYWKVVDTDLGSKAIAFGSWRTFREEQPRSEWGKSNNPPGDPPGDTNMHVFQAFMKFNEDAKKRVIAGRKRHHLSLLCTLPDHQRRGAAKMLLERGIELANEEGLDSWLVASIEGLPVYEKVGYRRVEGGNMALDLEPLGGKGVHRSTIMMRPLGKAADRLPG